VQWLLIRRYGGCGVLPSGTYHLGLPTEVPNRDRNATELFADLLQEIEGPVSVVRADERSTAHVTSHG